MSEDFLLRLKIMLVLLLGQRSNLKPEFNHVLCSSVWSRAKMSPMVPTLGPVKVARLTLSVGVRSEHGRSKETKPGCGFGTSQMVYVLRWPFGKMHAIGERRTHLHHWNPSISSHTKSSKVHQRTKSCSWSVVYHPFGCGSKKWYQNGTLVNGTKD